MIINRALIRNPMNWVIVTLMLIIVGIAGHLVLGYFGIAPAQAPQQVPSGDNPATTPVALRSDGTFAAISVGQ